jgi:phosphoglycerate dehydrogenase-like enzyme
MQPVSVLSTTNLKDKLLRRVADVSPRVSLRQAFCRTGEEVTPHMAAMTRRYNERLTDLFIENLRRYLSGRELLNRVDAERGY